MGQSREGFGGQLGGGHSLPAEAIVAAQDALVLFMGAELDGSVGHHAHHSGRVPAPQAEEALVEVGEVEEPEGLLRETGMVSTLACPAPPPPPQLNTSFVQHCDWGLHYPPHPALSPHILWVLHRDPSVSTPLTLGVGIVKRARANQVCR